MQKRQIISIITPSYNQGHFIEETITSVLDQQYPNLEYIIVDGGSTDNTVEIIKKYEKYLRFWVSESDNGQANAINKGLNYCSGNIINWLNSDDYLEPGALLKIVAGFDESNVQMVAGRVRTFSDTQEEVISNQNLTAEGLMCWKPGVKFIQPGVWMRRELLQACGGINEKYHYAFDWDLYIRYLYLYPTVKEIPEILVHFRLHKDSKTQSLSEKFCSEERIIIENLRGLSAFKDLHKACEYKIQKTGWTDLLSEISGNTQPFTQKLSAVLSQMQAYKKVSFSRQTVGALRAFLKKEII